ncbi:MAG: acyltransferase family protein [Litorimonas sp.]
MGADVRQLMTFSPPYAYEYNRIHWTQDCKTVGVLSMQSSLRFLLAWLVVVAHLTEGTQWTAHMGFYAVFGFYLLSGFLITLILNETYKGSSIAFFKNRVLRLYPIYFIIALFTLFVIFTFSDAEAFKNSWSVSNRLVDYLGNIFIFPFEFYDRQFRLIPPAWSVGVELINYFLLWLIIARHKYVAICCVVLAVLYHVATYIENPAWDLRYSPFQAAILPFSIGALIYFFKGSAAHFSESAIKIILTTTASLWVGNLLLCGFMGAQAFTFFNTSFYVNMILLGVMVWAFSYPSYSGRAKGLAKLLGDLSYPVFLIHWQVGFVMFTILGFQDTRGWLLLAASVVPILFLSWVSLITTAPLINPMRDRIRSESAV